MCTLTISCFSNIYVNRLRFLQVDLINDCRSDVNHPHLVNPAFVCSDCSFNGPLINLLCPQVTIVNHDSAMDFSFVIVQCWVLKLILVTSGEGKRGLRCQCRALHVDEYPKAAQSSPCDGFAPANGQNEYRFERVITA